MASSQARAHFEQLFRDRKLDRTLTSVEPDAHVPVPCTPSGEAALDERLGGGWPRGQISEIAGPRSSGRTRLAVATVAAATRRGEPAALVDTLDTFDPVSAVEAGPDWRLLLWVRGARLAHTRYGTGWTRDEGDLLAQAVDRALKAAALVLQAGGFGVVVLDVADVPAAVLRRLPFTTWFRLFRLVEGRDTAVVVVGAEPLTRSAGGVSLELGRGAGRWRGTSDRSRIFDGLTSEARIVRARFRARDGDRFTVGGRLTGAPARAGGIAR
jgi:recombination protein RecA